MRTVMILKGLPGCGKSTYAKELMKKERGRWKRVNRDDLRLMFDDSTYSKENEDFIRSVQDKMILSALEEGFDVIVDNTHLVPQTVKKLHKLVEAVGNVKVIEKAFNVSVSDCLHRNAQREGRARVPEKVIHDMARAAGIDRGNKLPDKEKYYEPRWAPGGTTGGPIMPAKHDPNLPTAIMCDLDGTLAIIGDRTPYDATDCDIKDHPNWPVIKCVLAMHQQGVKILFMSGRDQKYRPETERFIEKYCRTAVIKNTSWNRPDNEEIVPIPYELHMRGETAPDPDKMDQRKDNIIKNELFEKYVAGKYNVLFVLDDRNQVVDEWRRMGLTCFQVAPGAF